MRLILFDVDGTLVDSQHLLHAVMAAAFAAHGRPAPGRGAVKAVIGLSVPEAFQRLVGQDGPWGPLGDTFRGLYGPMRAEGLHQEALFDGIADLLDRLAAREDVTLGIATGKSRRGVDHLIAKHGWEGRFATIQTADHHPSKPHPSMARAALAETGLDPAAAVMVGDTSFDMAMARAAGMDAIGVAWGNHPVPELEGAGASRIAASVADLADFLGAQDR